MIFGLGTLYPICGLAQIHYGQIETAFSALLRSLMPRFPYLYVPSVIRSH